MIRTVGGKLMSNHTSDFENFLQKIQEHINILNNEPDRHSEPVQSLNLNLIVEKESNDMVNEPEFERIVDGDKVILIFTLPGASKENIKFKRKAGYLIVEARTRDRYYRKQVRLESYIDESSIKGRVKNGFLELRADKM